MKFSTSSVVYTSKPEYSYIFLVAAHFAKVQNCRSYYIVLYMYRALKRESFVKSNLGTVYVEISRWIHFVVFFAATRGVT